MSTTLLFFVVLGGLALLITVLLTLCAIHIGSDEIYSESQNLQNSNSSSLIKDNRRSFSRNDFPIACNDGSYAWFDRRNAVSE